MMIYHSAFLPFAAHPAANGAAIGWERGALVLGMLLAAGYVYDRAVVGPLETGDAGHPFTAGLVIVGVLGTLAGAAVLVGLLDTLLVLACFGASGFFMTQGAASRFLRAQRCERDAARRDVLERLDGGEG